jgi:hypothetical protein
MNYWLKRTELGTRQVLASAGTGANAGHEIEFQSDNTLAIYSNAPGASVALATTQVFRDPSAWGMLTFAFDTTQATASNRLKVYWNGVQITAFASSDYPAQNANLEFNNNVPHNIGRREISTTFYCGLYLAEIVWVDGLALDPSYFGFNDSNTGVWTPRQYTGTYGTNGFYVNFSDNSNTTAATLGKDYSGNGNNWTPNNFSVTAGAGNDSLVDTPTSYGTDTGVGGEVRGNYCTWNPLRPSGATLTNGNLDATTGNSGSSNSGYLTATFWMPTSGKYYYEVTPTNVNEIAIGLTTNSNNRAAIYYRAGDVYINGSVSFTGSSYTNNDVIGVAVDMDALTIRFYKNNTAQGSGTSSLSAMTGPFVPAIVHLSGAGSSIAVANFGQRAFAYTAPSGFKALCTQNLPTPTIGATSTTQANDYFDAVTYTGNGSTQNITGVGFQPDWTWIKSRSNASGNILIDAVRGVGRYLLSEFTDAEAGGGTSFLTAFNSDGFSVNVSPNTSANANAATYVAWNWKANGAGSSNTAGTITSTVSANTTSGFSIATFTTTGAAATIGHGLGVAPRMVIMKDRTNAASWLVYHASLASAANYLVLNATDASASNTTVWNNTAPTSTVFSIGTVFAASNYVAYCFAPVAGYSAFGSYTGNGSADGPFVYTGFRPRYVLVKRTDTGGAGFDWFIWDTARSTYNVASANLTANQSVAEGVTAYPLDINSNGLKIRNSATAYNASGGTYIYAAFAESPFKYSLAR